MCTELSRKIYNFKIYGKNNIKKGEKYIFCPNRECHSDEMWIIGCLDKETRKNIGKPISPEKKTVTELKKRNTKTDLFNEKTF